MSKKVDFKIEDSKLRVSVDPNEDGEPVVELMVDIAEIPDEVIDGIKKAREAKNA